MVSISCHCGACSIEVFDKRPTLSLLCGCEDCRQALEWGTKSGARRPSPLPQLVYMRSDLVNVKGYEAMVVFQLREGARSTRIYCSKCYAVLGVDHPNYFDNVFMFFRNHCETNFELPENPDAAIFLDDLPVPDRHLIPSNVPLFYSFPRDREKFRSINSVVETFKVANHPPKGHTFKDLINSLGKIEILDLQQGERLQACK